MTEISIISLKHREWLDWPQTRMLMKAFTDGDEALRFVGGAVRDGILGVPVKEVDAATPATPDKVIALLEAAGHKAVPTGIAHGTVTAVIEGVPFEITTLRRDVSCDGRHAEVEYGTSWEEDALRRDFTMNALFCDAEGIIYDYTGGVSDAMAGKVRFIGDARQRIQEDALRILRFFRFYAYYGRVPPDGETLACCAESADMLENLSGERIQAEMFKLLASDKAAVTLGFMQESGMLPYVLNVPSIPDALSRLPGVCEKLGLQNDGSLALALILRDSKNDGGASLDKVRTRWKFSTKIYNRINAFLSEDFLSENISEAEQKRCIRRLGAPLFCDLVLLSAANNFSDAYKSMLSLAKNWQIPAFPVTGDDLEGVGITPGPEMGELLRELEVFWERNNYMPDKNQLIERLEGLISK